MRHQKLKCGCVIETNGDRERWSAQCTTHQAEHDEYKRVFLAERATHGEALLAVTPL